MVREDGTFRPYRETLPPGEETPLIDVAFITPLEIFK